MSQFKSRVPSGLQFTTAEGPQGGDQGYCCSNTGDGTYNTSTRYECFVKNGFFVLSDPDNTCPKIRKGQCCYYTASGNLAGLAKNTPYCGCGSAYIPGYYKHTFIDNEDVAKGVTCATIKTVDKAAPTTGACCYWKLVDDKYINLCETVDDIDVCDSLHEGGTAGLKYTFYLAKNCIKDGGEIVCNSGLKRTQAQIEAEPQCVPDTDKDCYREQNMLGNCCTLLEDGLRGCSVTTKENCSGFWSYLGGVVDCNGSTLCSGVYFPQKIENVYTPTTASLNTLKNSANELEKLPTTNTLYQGGLYVGIFEPGSNINIVGSEVFGNLNTGAPITYKARGTGSGTRNKKWILIAAPSDISLSSSNIFKPDSKTSVYDGFYSTNQETTTFFKTIKNVNINGFSDWYIPSQDELAFYFKNISSTFATNGYTNLKPQYYLTSTHYSVDSIGSLQTLGNKYFAYVQSANPLEYGKVILMPQDSLVCNVRLFRRIYLGS
jgi:hypothetical protein